MKNKIKNILEYIVCLISFTIIIYGFALMFSAVFLISKNIIFNIAWGVFIIIGLDLKITWHDKEIFRLCWGLQWLFKEILPKYRQ